MESHKGTQEKKTGEKHKKESKPIARFCRRGIKTK